MTARWSESKPGREKSHASLVASPQRQSAGAEKFGRLNSCAAVVDANIHQGFIDEALTQAEIPNFKDRTFYFSGPRAMLCASKAF
jgi:ferredoxin-NADP reductase